MRVADPLHGEITFDEPILIALLESEALQRLDDIEMGGYSAGFFPGAGYSRLEHACGVSYLLRLGGAGLEEQIFGLLHDVNHSVFSHAVDYALASGSEERQSHQDETFQAFVAASPIPHILRSSGFDSARVLDETNFPLAETEIPALCADRLDYAFRTMLHYRSETRSGLLEMLEALQSDARRWYFADRNAAARFAAAFHRIDEQIMDAFPSAVMFRAVGDCLHAALERNVLSMSDLYGRERDVLIKLEQAASRDRDMQRHWRRMQGMTAAIPSDDPNALTASCKSRIVDPLFDAGDAGLKRLSDVVPAWQAVVAEGLQPKTYRFCFLD